MPYYPDVERRVIENYLYKRNSTNWVRKNGHWLRPHEILLDFSVWMARERVYETPEPVSKSENKSAHTCYTAELLPILMGDPNYGMEYQ